MNIPGYDDWKLATPHDDEPTIGTEEGKICGRSVEPDEDAPRGYRPKPCKGTMVFKDVEGCTCFICAPCNRCVDNPLICDTCGETVE
jgi:hypothetical protein